MMTMRMILKLGIALALFFNCVTAFAGEQEKTHGWVDWEKGFVFATAVGSADMSKMVNEVQAEGVALETARHLAYAELLETVGKISLDSMHTYDTQMAVDKLLKVETHGILKGAHVVKQEFNWTNSGTPRAVVTVRVSIGDDLLYPISGWAKRSIATQPQLPRFSTKTEKPKEKYTGLIIDATSTKLQPVFFPKILTSKGAKELYGLRSVDLITMTEKLLAGYTNSVEQAKMNSRAGSNPLVVKAQKAYGARKGDAIVSDEDAKLILAADVDSNFLSNCNIVFVVKK